MLYRNYILLIYLLTVFSISKAQVENQIQEIEIGPVSHTYFLDSTSASYIRHVSDSLLIMKLGKNNFNNWLTSVYPLVETTSEWVSHKGTDWNCPDCPIGMPYTEEIKHLVSYDLRYMFNIQGVSRFFITSTAKAKNNDGIRRFDNSKQNTLMKK